MSATASAPKKKGKRSMLGATILMAVLAVIAMIIAYYQGEGRLQSGLQASWSLTLDVLPLLVFAFILAGMVPVLIPDEIVARWLGNESGWRGILIGSLAGGLTPGGPYVSLPLVVGLYRAGAGIGTTVAFLTGWSLIAVARLPMEFGILGVRLTLIRLVSTMLLPPVAGFIAHIFFGKAGS